MKTYTRLAMATAAISYFVFLCWLYYPASRSFFSNDDWVLLYHSPDASRWWEYFSLKTIWMYRPLQTMQIGLTHHFAGLDYAPYGYQLLAMHLGVTALVWQLLRKMFGAGIATTTAILFSVSCFSPDILLWVSNMNTLQNAIVTLIAAILFYHYLETGSRKWFYGAVAAGILNCFTKESSINLTLVLASVWICWYLQVRWQKRPVHAAHMGIFASKVVAFKRATLDLAPFMIIAIGFFVVHRLFFENIERRYKLDYGFASPTVAFWNLTHSVNQSLLGYITQPLLYHAPSMRSGVEPFLKGTFILGPVLLLLGFWRRSPAIIYGTLFILAALFPTFLLARYDARRYYYLPAMGGMLIAVSLLWPYVTALVASLKRASTSEKALSPVRRGAGYAGAIAILLIFLGNVIVFQHLIGSRLLQAGFFRQTFQYLQIAGPKLPPQSLVIFRVNPNTFVRKGLGATEMLRLASERKDVHAISVDQPIPDNLRKQLDGLQHQYLLDIATTAPALVQIKP